MEGRRLKGMFGSQAKPEAEEGRSTMTQAGPVTETSNQPSEVAPTRKAKTLEAKEVNLYYGDFHAVEGVNMTIEPNKVTALIGSSGCGKTTFLRSLNRMHELTPGASVKGNIELDGEDIYGSGVDPVAVRRLIGMVFQQPNPFPTMSIYDNVAAGLNFNSGRVSKSDKDAVVERSLRGAHLWDEVKDRLDKPGSGLSGGQQQRLCIARAIATRPEVLLMDEPCSALDPRSTAVIEELIGELRRDLAVVIVTHNLQQAYRVADYVGFMYLGDMVEYASAPSLFNSPTQERTREYVSGAFG